MFGPRRFSGETGVSRWLPLAKRLPRASGLQARSVSPNRAV